MAGSVLIELDDLSPSPNPQKAEMLRQARAMHCPSHRWSAAVVGAAQASRSCSLAHCMCSGPKGCMAEVGRVGAWAGGAGRPGAEPV